MEAEDESAPSELKIDFSTANNHLQYQHSATKVAFYSMACEAPLSGVKRGDLWLGDRDSCSMVQLKHRNIENVIIAEEDMYGEWSCIIIMWPCALISRISIPTHSASSHSTPNRSRTRRRSQVLQDRPFYQRQDLLRCGGEVCQQGVECRQRRTHLLSNWPRPFCQCCRLSVDEKK